MEQNLSRRQGKRSRWTIIYALLPRPSLHGGYIIMIIMFLTGRTRFNDFFFVADSGPDRSDVYLFQNTKRLNGLSDNNMENNHHNDFICPWIDFGSPLNP